MSKLGWVFGREKVFKIFFYHDLAECSSECSEGVLWYRGGNDKRFVSDSRYFLVADNMLIDACRHLLSFAC